MKKSILILVFLSFLGGCATVSQPQAAGDASSITPENQAGMRKIVPTDLKLGSDYSTPVISNAQKFIVPVPVWGQAGEPLVYPKGQAKAGQPILDYTGKPVGDRGLVFLNAKDKSWQAVAGDGKGVIIINEVTPEQAQKLDQKIRSLHPNPNDLNLAELKQVLTFAREQLGLGDMYNSTRSYVKEKMTPAIAGKTPQLNGTEIAAYGFKKRDDRDINQAVYIPGKFVFVGPAATPQIFENGGVIVEQGGKMRGVQPDIFVRTYTLSDGRPITSVVMDVKIQDK